MSKEKKIIAAKKAFEYVEEGMKLGLGTGSTADEFTKILSDNVTVSYTHLRAQET